MDRKDHYATLGVPRTADAKQIRSAYRRLARRYHPDLHPGNGAAEETLKRINEAYGVLSDPEKRRQYHVLGHDFEDILRDEDILRRSSGFGSTSTDKTRAAPPFGTGAQTSGYPQESRGLDPSLIRSLKVGMLGLAVVSLCLIGFQRPRAPNAATVAEQRAEKQLPETQAALSELRNELGSFQTRLLGPGTDAWARVCLWRNQNGTALDPSLKPTYERQYQEGAERVIDRITRAESAGIFALPLAAQDQDVLRASQSLRTQLQDTLGAAAILNCRDDLPVRIFRWETEAADTLERCLREIIRRGPKGVRSEARAGRSVCTASWVPGPAPVRERPPA
jgi:hypothetical protein